MYLWNIEEILIGSLRRTVIDLRARGVINLSWYIGAAAMMAIAVATVVGNVSVMTALKRARRLPTHYPLASLITADLLVGTFVVPIAAARELFVFQLDWPYCACWSTLDVLCCTASILSLCALGWERWSAITSPLARARRAKLAKIFAATVWPVSAAVALPTAFIPSPKHHLEGEVDKACDVNINVGYVFFSVSLSFYLPAAVMILLYTKILRALSLPPTIRAHRGRSPVVDVVQVTIEKRSESACNTPKKHEKTSIAHKLSGILSPGGCHLKMPSIPQLQTPTKSPKNVSPYSISMAARQRRATRTIVMLMSLFLLCWLPFFIMLPIDSLCECVSDTAWQWCTWLGYTNSALNPVVYAAASPSVRRALRASLSLSSSRQTDVTMIPFVRRG